MPGVKKVVIFWPIKRHFSLIAELCKSRPSTPPLEAKLLRPIRTKDLVVYATTTSAYTQPHCQRAVG